MPPFPKVDDDTLLGARVDCEGNEKNCMFQDAKKLGFSTQEIKHLKRLYKEQIDRRVRKK